MNSLSLEVIRNVQFIILVMAAISVLCYIVSLFLSPKHKFILFGNLFSVFVVIILVASHVINFW